MVWQAAQLRVNRVLPASRSALLVLTTGTWTPSPGVSDCTQAAISRVWSRLNRGGLRVACTLELARGIRPVDTQKSTVPAPRPCRLGARMVPEGLGSVAARAVGGEQGLAGGDEGLGQLRRRRCRSGWTARGR